MGQGKFRMHIDAPYFIEIESRGLPVRRCGNVPAVCTWNASGDEQQPTGEELAHIGTSVAKTATTMSCCKYHVINSNFAASLRMLRERGRMSQEHVIQQ